MAIELDKAYDASSTEDRIYQTWLDSGYFNPDKLPERYTDAESYSIVLPPPNVTGVLHMGHAFEDTIQDVMIRFQRMLGKRTLWIPGTDHAAIATQAKFEKEHYKKTEKSRHDYSREEFFSMIQEFALENQQNILSQLHKLGLSLDWDRLAFTLDEQREIAVRTAFKEMHDAGLIYRKNRVVNWDPKGQTTVSDDEIEYEETKATLYTFRYAPDFPIPIATTRPETKFGDTAVAVNPNDKRYQQYIGQEFDLEFCGTPIHIKVIADESVEKDFGTGALGVTPAHSMADYELGERHNLPSVTVINEFAKMIIGGENIVGKKTSEAREITAGMLREAGLLEKEEDIQQNLSKAQRTGGVIEPLPKLQWFIDVNKKFPAKTSKLAGIVEGQDVTLKEVMKLVVENKQIQILPERFEKTYYHWIDNLRDWCISRQIIYGHRIPAWHPADTNEYQEGTNYKVSVEDINDPNWAQDTDTLDTWFSSGLWTFSTLGWPKNAEDLSNFHPTSAIVPGYEILFFWVARMILMSGFLLGDIPFKKIYLHGIVRDKQGRKFSKSLNNGIDPLEMTEKYGTDALRMALIFGAAPGNDVIFDEQKVKGMKHFGNKLWNIARYVLANVDSPELSARPELKTEADKLIDEQLEDVIKTVTDHVEAFRLHEAAQALYQFVWYELADVYIEASKTQLQDEKLKANTQQLLLLNLHTILKLLHPFMPFVTEEIWSKLGQKQLLLVSNWPKPENAA